MNQKFIQSVILGSLMLGALTLGNFNANATGFNKSFSQGGKVISTNQFYDLLNKTNPNEVAVTFGLPDQMTTLKNADGTVSGVVWTYENAVAKQSAKLDANFVLVDGVFTYVTLSDS